MREPLSFYIVVGILWGIGMLIFVMSFLGYLQKKKGHQ